MPREALLLAMAEVSITLVGFAGIVVFLGRRAEGSWSEADRTRMWGMIEAGLLTLGLSLLPFLVWELGSAGADPWGVSSGIFVVFGGLSLVVWIRRGRVVMKTEDPEVSTGAGVGAMVLSGLILLSLAFNAVGIGFERDFGPYLIAILWYLALACIMFVRLLRFW